MSDEELYKEVILDHYRSPRNRGRIENADLDLHRDNPLCGDEVHLFAEVSDGQVSRVSFEGQGCSISMASTSIMTEKLKGLPLEDAEGLAASFKALMQGKSPADAAELGELMALEGVKKYPVRIKCALLGWNTFLEGLKAYREKHGG